MANQSRTPLGRRLVLLYERLRSPEAHLSGLRTAPSNSVMCLIHAKYLLLESKRANGTPVCTPMWLAIVDDTIFLRTEAECPKVRRIRRHPIVKVAPCTTRGVPIGDDIECVARILPQEQEAQAEAALRRSYGLPRRLFNVFARNDYVYIELKPLNTRKRPAPEDETRASGLRVVRDVLETPPDAA
ncbi:MAG: PPOX class F420-dependent oxidoreductase [Solirubrobacteraceae bacterium]